MLENKQMMKKKSFSSSHHSCLISDVTLRGVSSQDDFSARLHPNAEEDVNEGGGGVLAYGGMRGPVRRSRARALPCVRCVTWHKCGMHRMFERRQGCTR